MIVKYVNNKGVVVNLNKGPYKMLVSDLLDYEWDIVKSSSSIAGFEKEITKKSINIDILKGPKGSSRELMNALSDVFEWDIAVGIPGKLYIDSNYLLCYVYSSEKSNWETDVITSSEYGIITDTPFWITESTKSFASSGSQTSLGLDYPYDYSFDYAPKVSSDMIANDNYAATDFRMVIYGPAVNPAVTIGSNTYKIYTEVKTGEYLVIDTQEKAVKQYDNTGGMTVKYNSRDKDYEIFAPIPPGVSPVIWDGDFGFDVTMYMKRSEPKWIL